MDLALRDAEFNNIALSSKEIATALATANTRDVSILAALAWARIGETDRAKRLADDLAGRFPLNTVINHYWLPTIYASIEIQRGNPAKAVELLQTTARYELGSPLPQFEVGGSLYPVYIRGQAYSLLHQGADAIGEFQKFLGPARGYGELPSSRFSTSPTRSCVCVGGRFKKSQCELPRIPRALERRRHRHCRPKASQSRVREATAVADTRCEPTERPLQPRLLYCLAKDWARLRRFWGVT